MYYNLNLALDYLHEYLAHITDIGFTETHMDNNNIFISTEFLPANDMAGSYVLIKPGFAVNLEGVIPVVAAPCDSHTVQIKVQHPLVNLHLNVAFW